MNTKKSLQQAWNDGVRKTQETMKQETEQANAALMLEHYLSEKRKRSELFRETEKIATSPFTRDSAAQLERSVNNINKWIDAFDMSMVSPRGNFETTQADRDRMKIELPACLKKGAEKVLDFEIRAKEIKTLEYEIV
jgi:hypothetical protein